MNYQNRNVWTDRMPEIKIMVLTMSVKQVADYYGVKPHNVYQAMSERNVSARRVRYEYNLELNKQ